MASLFFTGFPAQYQILMVFLTVFCFRYESFLTSIAFGEVRICFDWMCLIWIYMGPI